MYRVRGKQKVFKAPWRIRNVCYTLVSRQLERRFRWGRGGKVWSTFRLHIMVGISDSPESMRKYSKY